MPGFPKTKSISVSIVTNIGDHSHPSGLASLMKQRVLSLRGMAHDAELRKGTKQCSHRQNHISRELRIYVYVSSDQKAYRCFAVG